MRTSRTSRNKKKRKNKGLIFIVPLIVLLISFAIYFIYSSNTNTSNNSNNENKDNNIISEEEEENNTPIDEPIEEVVEEKKEEIVEEVKPITQPEEEITTPNVSASDNIVNFWFGRNTTLSRPISPITDDITKKYNAYFIGEDKPVIYLTFDEGISISEAENNLNTLKKYNVKATFFLTKGFIDANKDLVNRMVNEGHTCGNHTYNHKNMATVASNSKEDFTYELKSTEDSFRNATNKEMDKVFRFPEGTYSEKALLYAKELGYKSVFWSFAYKDWNRDWNSKDEALKWMKNYYHPGAVYLLHGVNKANSKALPEFIEYMQGIGYTFDTVNNIP